MIEKSAEYFLEDYYSCVYQKIAVTAIPNSLAFKVQNTFLESPFKGSSIERILEVGAGSGHHLSFVKQEFQEYIMLDTRNLSQVQSDSGSRKVRFIQGSVEKIPLPSESVDRIVATCILHHVENPLSAIYEMRRVVRKNGYISLLIANDPGSTYRFLRKISSRRRAKKLGILDYVKFVEALDHRNHYLAIMEIIKWVHKKDDVRIKGFPFFVKSFNLNVLSRVIIRKSG